MQIPNIYENRQYKRYIAVPLILILVSLYFIPNIPLGIDFRGGMLFTVFVEKGDLQNYKPLLQEKLAVFSKDVGVREFENPAGKGFEIELQLNEGLEKAGDSILQVKRLQEAYASESLRLAQFEGQATLDEPAIAAQKERVAADEKALLDEANAVLAAIGSAQKASNPGEAQGLVEEEFSKTKSKFREDVLAQIKAVVPVSTYSSKEIGASLSRFFLGKTTEILIYSFVASAIVILVIFRSFIPSLAVLFGAFADIVMTLGVMGLFQIPLTLSTIAALLMLIGFSLDTDMLLTIRVLKRTEDTPVQRTHSAMTTALLMNATTVAAFTVLLIVSSFLQIQTYSQIAAVAVAGGIVDFFATWGVNAVLILWYAERRKT